jgi:outer membrane murein-binding lipoprotein Lpp
VKKLKEEIGRLEQKYETEKAEWQNRKKANNRAQRRLKRQNKQKAKRIAQLQEQAEVK